LKAKKFYSVKMCPMRSSGWKRRDLLHQTLLQSGFYKKTLKFPTRRGRLNFLIQLFKPKKDEITRGDKHAITVWLRKQGLTEKEINRFYLEAGIPNHRVAAQLRGVCHQRSMYKSPSSS